MNKRLKKIITSMAIISVLIIPTQVVFANEVESIPTSVTQEISVMPMEIMQKEKTVTKNYSSLSSIPETIAYEEYTGVWWRGTLILQEVVKSSNGYRATYTGTLFANS